MKLIKQRIVPGIAPAQSCCDSANFQRVVVNTDAQKNGSSTIVKFGLFGAWLHKQIAANPMNQGGALQRCLWVGDADGGLGWVEMGLVEANWRRSRHRD